MNIERLKKVYSQNDLGLLDIQAWQYLYLHEKVWEGDNQRIWRFKWLVIKVKKPNHPDWTFTIKGKVSWVDVEKIYPLSFSSFEKVELLDEFKTRKSKLYYIRDKQWKDAKMKTIISSERRWKDLVKEIKKFENK